MIRELDIQLRDGRTVHVYDTGTDASLTVIWHHGTPQIGAPPDPFLTDWSGLRWVGYDRPAYGGSTRQPGRTIASAAGDVAAIADALGIDRFAVVGHSGGSPHALACAALLSDRVVRGVCMAGLAPFEADGLDWFAGMADAGAGELRAAVDGEDALAALLASTEFDETQFTPTDHAALGGRLGVPRPIGAAGDARWSGRHDRRRSGLRAALGLRSRAGAGARAVRARRRRPDRAAAHSRWLADHGQATELWMRPGDGHLAVLDCYTDALAWLTR